MSDQREPFWNRTLLRIEPGFGRNRGKPAPRWAYWFWGGSTVGVTYFAVRYNLADLATADHGAPLLMHRGVCIGGWWHRPHDMRFGLSTPSSASPVAECGWPWSR